MTDTNQISTHSITTLTLGILSILIPFIGLILGVLGVIFYRKSIQSEEAGRGMAIAGLICSIVGLTFQVLIVISYLAFINVTVELDTAVNLIMFKHQPIS